MRWKNGLTWEENQIMEAKRDFPNASTDERTSHSGGKNESLRTWRVGTYKAINRIKPSGWKHQNPLQDKRTCIACLTQHTNKLDSCWQIICLEVSLQEHCYERLNEHYFHLSGSSKSGGLQNFPTTWHSNLSLLL